MRRRVLILVAALLLCAGGSCLIAQESDSQKIADTDEDSSLAKWKLINTGIFALLLGYGVIRFAPKFFSARSFDIQKAIKDATGLKIDADFRYSAIDKKMSNLAAEVARMKAEAAAEMDREHQRLLHETEEEIEHIDRNANYEIDSLRKEGALRVKRHTAQLAFGLAEHRLQAHFAQNDSDTAVGEFTGLVGGRS